MCFQPSSGEGQVAMTKAFETKRCGMEKQYVGNLERKIPTSIQHLPPFSNTKSQDWGLWFTVNSKELQRPSNQEKLDEVEKQIQTLSTQRAQDMLILMKKTSLQQGVLTLLQTTFIIKCCRSRITASKGTFPLGLYRSFPMALRKP